MPLFRFHRGSLEDSLKTTFRVEDKKDLFDKLNNFNTLLGRPRQDEDLISAMPCIARPEDILVKEYIFDNRIGWDTQIVLIKHQCVTRDPYIIGFLSEPFLEKIKE